MKRLTLIPAILLMLFLTACGGGTGNRTVTSNSSSVAQILDQAVQESALTLATPEPDLSTPLPRLADMDVSSADAEVDLTQLSSTLVFSLVSQMMYEPEDFIGKTVKMEGTLNVFEGESRPYFACLVADATACCANGIEFQWAGDHAYPEDYPAQGDPITVVGTFELYEEDGFQYCQLADAELTLR